MTLVVVAFALPLVWANPTEPLNSRIFFFLGAVFCAIACLTASCAGSRDGANSDGAAASSMPVTTTEPVRRKRAVMARLFEIQAPHSAPSVLDEGPRLQITHRDL